AHLSRGRVEGAEAEVARREIELLVEERVVGDVHLAVEAERPALGADDDRAVVVEAGRALLEDGDDDRDPRLLRGAAERLRARAGDRLREAEERLVLLLAEVRRAVELGQADDLRSRPRRVADARRCLLEVVLGPRRHRHLHETDFEGTGHLASLPDQEGGQPLRPKPSARAAARRGTRISW